MRKILIFTTFVLWMMGTIFLLCTVIGIILLVKDDDDNRSTWMQLGMDIKDVLIKDDEPVSTDTYYPPSERINLHD